MSQGHALAEVERYTPRQMHALTTLINRRRKKLAAENLAVGALAASGDGKAIKTQLQKWGKD